MILTSNQRVGPWAGGFGEPIIATAMLDRRLHHRPIRNMKGDAYRRKETQQAGRLNKAPVTDNRSPPGWVIVRSSLTLLAARARHGGMRHEPVYRFHWHRRSGLPLMAELPTWLTPTRLVAGPSSRLGMIRRWRPGSMTCAKPEALYQLLARGLHLRHFRLHLGERAAYASISSCATGSVRSQISGGKGG